MVFAQDSESRKHERIASELDLASDIQANMLPKILPGTQKNLILRCMQRMYRQKKSVALFMVIAKTLIKDHAQLGLGPRADLHPCQQSAL